MAGNVQFGTTWLSYTPSLPSGASEAAGHPVTNLGVYDRPLRTWRSQDTTSEKIVLDLGAAKTVAALFVNHVNFTTLLVEGAADSGFTSGVVTLGTFTIGKDRRVGRYKAWCAIGSPQSKRYLRLTPSNPVGSATYYEIGVVGVFDAAGIVTLDDNPSWPWRTVRQQATTRIGFAGGGEDAITDGAPYLEITMASEVWRRTGGSTVLTQLLDLCDLGPAALLVLHENRGDTAAAYGVRRTSELEVAEQFVTFSGSLTFREAL